MGVHDPIARLTAFGISVAWAATMPYTALWLPTERVAVLNSQVSRSELVAEVLSLIQLDDLVVPHSPSELT